jgi:hypothetical protein
MSFPGFKDSTDRREAQRMIYAKEIFHDVELEYFSVCSMSNARYCCFYLVDIVFFCPQLFALN